jgi:hypothetical protein
LVLVFGNIHETPHALQAYVKGGKLPDPIIGTAIVKAASNAAGSDLNQVAPGLIRRILGPAADELGEALRRYTAYRVGNVDRILKVAERKTRGDTGGGIVHPRVAHEILDDGSYCDDELMAEYYGGILAAGRTHSGRDDRAITWSGLISSMSSIQIRAHYLLYREWAARLHGIADLNLGDGNQRSKTRMDIELSEFVAALAGDSGLQAEELLSDAIIGLVRIGLLDNIYAFGPRSPEVAVDSPYENVLRVVSSPAGLELYGWAQGLAGVTAASFPSKAVPFEIDGGIPRLTNVAFIQLDSGSPTATTADSQ